jgi:hypothetical protein
MGKRAAAARVSRLVVSAATGKVPKARQMRRHANPIICFTLEILLHDTIETINP